MKTLGLLLILLLVATSCEKIVAEDITNKTPVLIVPTVGDTVDQNPVHFKWEAMEGATKYRLEVVSPSFAAISTFALDSLITGTDFYFDLDSNEYELRLTAQNGGYSSKVLGPIKFWVGVQSSGGGNTVVLTSPSNGSYQNGSFNNQFTWSSLSGTTSYEYSLRQGSSFETGSIINTQNGIATTTYTEPTTLTEGEYFWGVKAYLSGSETPYTVRQLFIDETFPNIAAPSAPANFAFLPQGVITFTWGNGTDPGTIHAPVNSILEISTDSGFGTIVQSVSIVGGTTNVTLTPGTYFWRVTNIDDAGNDAGVSTTFQFTAT